MAYYTYLISSLPMLRFNSEPPLEPERFLEMSVSLLPEEERTILKKIFDGDEVDGPNGTLRRWLAFDTALRNEFVKIRASRRNEKAEKYLKGYASDDPEIARLAMRAHRTPSIVKAEMDIDQARWDHLDTLSVGHYFDLDSLIIYVLKLSILKKWSMFRKADKDKLLSHLTEAPIQ